jgi:MYXO-CTERM domain-containing protein
MMTSPLQHSGWARAAVAAIALAVPAIAHADVVSPPPSICPPGTEGVTSHSGPECVKKAPKNCPRGWRGVQGGTCMLAPCSADETCQSGEECVEHLACLESFQDDFYDYGEELTESRTEGMPPPGLLAGPPLPRKRRPAPVTRYNAVNLCSAEVACNAPRMCLPEKLCVPKGTRGLAYRGSNITPARVARKGPVPAALTSSAAPGASAPALPGDAGAADAGAVSRPPPPGDARPLEGTAPISGGCAGCAVGDASASMTGLGLLALAALLWARRR